MLTLTELAELQLVVEGVKTLDDLSEELRMKLYEYFLPNMPIGIAKARTGDPWEWITEHLPVLVGELLEVVGDS